MCACQNNTQPRQVYTSAQAKADAEAAEKARILDAAKSAQTALANARS